MMPLAFIRHGPTLWNEQRKLQGQADIPLSEQGIERVKTWVLPDKFRNYQWFASPLKRAQKTASLLGLKTKLFLLSQKISQIYLSFFYISKL